MIFFVIISLIILSMVFNNHDKKGLFYFMLAILLSFMIFNFENPDRENYFKLYNDIAEGKFHEKSEIGMQIIMYVMTRLHIRFDIFLILFYLFAIYLFIRFINKWNKRPVMVLMLYMVYPFFLDIVQIRTMMATMIVLNALEYLLEFSKKNIISYIILVFIAGSIHYSAFFFFFFLMAFLTIKQILYTVTGILVFFIMMQTEVLEYIQNTFPFLIKQLLRYIRLSNGISNVSLFVLLLSYMLNIFICFLYFQYIKGNGSVNEEVRVSELMIKINILSLCIMPFSLFALEFMRLYRLVMILNYNIVGNLKSYNSKNDKFKLIPLEIMFLMLFSCLFAFYRYIYMDHMENVVQVLFEKNYFWRLLVS